MTHQEEAMTQHAMNAEAQSVAALDLDAIEARAGLLDRRRTDGWSLWADLTDDEANEIGADIEDLVAEVRRKSALAAMTARAESAEAEVVTLRAKVAAVEALAHDWPCSDETCDGDCTGCAYADDLRAALATTGEGK